MTASFETMNGGGLSRFLLLCDHASNRLPEAYDRLGLPETQLERHIGYDIGAAGVTRVMAARLGATAFLTCFSRLLIDPNRGEDDPTLIMKLSDGAVVPGNAAAGAAETETRIAVYHRPYHAAITADIDARLSAGIVPVILSIHSFTPFWRGTARPWHAAVLWDRDPRLAVPLIGALRVDPGLVVGDNEPYSGALKGDTLYRHGTMRGLPHALIEIRQDLITTADGQQDWGERLATILTGLLAEPQIGEACAQIRHYGSRAR